MVYLIVKTVQTVWMLGLFVHLFTGASSTVWAKMDRYRLAIIVGYKEDRYSGIS